MRVQRHDGVLYSKNGVTWLIAFLVIIGESFGSLGPLAGFLTRFAAASLAVIMLGAVTMVHLPNGVFMTGPDSSRVKALNIICWLGIAAALLVTGGGRWSVDRVVAERIAP